MKTTLRYLLFIASALVAIAAPQLQAQASAQNAGSQTSFNALATPLPNGPLVRQVGVTREMSVAGPQLNLQGSPTRRDLSWMVLGGAMLVVGGVVGGDGGTIIMVAGGVIGLIGLWRYLQYS